MHSRAQSIVSRMMDKDYFSQWLGIEVMSVSEGYCRLGMKVRKEMLNGFGIAHGGISYSLADSALAFASNSKGRQSLSIDTSINHVKALHEGDKLTAIAECVTETDKLGHYKVTVTLKDDADIVALFQGMVFKTSKDWDL
jgi:acyl-CoA thioesterase